MNRFDKVVSAVIPVWAQWAHKRDQLMILASYDAAQQGRNRKISSETGSANTANEGSAVKIREQARALDQNHDLARGILTSLVNKVIGAQGIGVEFMPKDLAGNPMPEFALKLSDAFNAWSNRPEVTGEFNRARSERLICRSWLRDGEVFIKLLSGNVSGLKYPTPIKFGFEMLESDYVPFDATSQKKNTIQGIEVNAWGARTAYHVLKDHPGDTGFYSQKTKRIPADKMLHPRMCDRIHQLRGMSIFASVITRLQDIKDYEESERVAARIAAAMAAYIRKGDPSMYTAGDSDSERSMKIAPGMVFDNLRPGEEVGTISHNRPNSGLGAFRADMLKAVASGTGAQYSTISKNYDGTYSSQRQELIEQQANYFTLSEEFIDQVTAPIVRMFLDLASLTIDLPIELDKATLHNVEYQAPAMPWIDPLKEAKGYAELVQGGFASKTKVIRSLGGTPQRVHQQIVQERKVDDEAELVFTSDARHALYPPMEEQEEENDNNNGDDDE